MYGIRTKKQYLGPFQEQWPIEFPGNCADDSEFVRANSEYSNYLLRAGYYISSVNNPFQNVQLLSQETLVRKTEKNQVNLANAPSVSYLSRNVLLPLHPHIILLLVKYTKLFSKTLDQQWTLVSNLKKCYL